MTKRRSNDELDALLGAIARAGTESPAIEEEATSAAEDEALIAGITARVQAQQSAPIKPQSTSATERRRPWWLGVATAASLALAWLLVPRPYDAALPEYAFEISGLDAQQRDHPATSALHRKGAITQGNRLVVTLRPETTTGVAVAARLWHARGDAIELLDVPMQRSAAGVVRLDAEVGSELRLLPGNHQLWLVIGPDDYLPEASALHATLQPSASPGRYVLPLSLTVRAAAP